MFAVRMLVTRRPAALVGERRIDERSAGNVPSAQRW
jgi:hypothetical protein